VNVSQIPFCIKNLCLAYATLWYLTRETKRVVLRQYEWTGFREAPKKRRIL